MEKLCSNSRHDSLQKSPQNKEPALSGACPWHLSVLKKVACAVVVNYFCFSWGSKSDRMQNFSK